MHRTISPRDVHPPRDPDRSGAHGSGPRHRKKRRPPLWVLIVGVLVAVLVPSLANAGAPTFSDVPPSHPFYEDIQWMASSGVTDGYQDGTFRPGKNVTRGEMSAFVRRLFDYQDDMSWSVRRTGVSTTATNYVDLASASTTVVVPDGAWANISARFAAESVVIGPAGTWGTVRLMVSRNGGPFEEMSPGQGTDAAFDSAGDGSDWEAHAIERLAEGPGGTYTVKAQYAVAGASTFILDDYSLVVETDLQPSTFVPG